MLQAGYASGTETVGKLAAIDWPYIQSLQLRYKLAGPHGHITSLGTVITS